MLIQHSMTPGHRPWKKFILTGGALSAAWWPCPPFTLNNSISLALILCILTWTTPHGLNVTNAIPPFIYSVQPGNLFKLSDPNVFFVHSFVVGSFRYPTPSPCCLIYISILFPQFFKMGQRPLCPDDKKPKKKKKGKKSETDETKRHSSEDRGGSTHQDQRIGLFTADAMSQCIAKIKEVEGEAARTGNPPKFSRNQISKKYGLSPSTVSKRMTGKVVGMGPQVGGARRGRIFQAG